ncbi:MAG: cysteine--tRNA ligase, partial [Patescibacteria group bacterium]
MLKLYNTLTKKIEEFQPLKPEEVTLYCCGPTVYDFAHIGNFRTYTLTDLLVRTLKYLGYKVRYVMNITDVGHLTSNSDTGEDKLEKGARREGKTAWEIAKFYTEAFLVDSQKLNLLEPDVRPRPTEHIAEQIAMVQKLLDKGFAYKIDDGIYFDTSRFKKYGELTGQSREELKAGARVEVNPQKKNLTDFALWKFTPNGVRRDMEWDSPWGKGFPGWHIECSAMSMKYLGEQFDIHTGGADLIPIHHTNEIAQSESTTGISPFVRFWIHGQFILVDGEKMAKSKNNFYKLSDIEARGFAPLALRYLYLTAHYRTFLNFTWEALQAAQASLDELRSQISNLKSQISKRSTLSSEKLQKIDKYREKFKEALENDLNIPQALAVAWEVAKS